MDVPVAITEEDIQVSKELCAFVDECPSPFHTVLAICRRLEAAGFRQLTEAEDWGVRPGGCHYVTRNGSSIIAFKLGREAMHHPHFSIVASHTDSPSFKVKAVPELVGPQQYVRLNVEGYGGMIERTWLDRPLSLAGRVLVSCDTGIQCRLFAPEEDLLIIPSVAIHQDREVNKGSALKRHVDLCPLFSAGVMQRGSFVAFLADRLGVEPARILSYDLLLANRQKSIVWGVAHEFVSAPRLDDLQCSFSSLSAFLNAQNDCAITVYACFDNEEVGSGTMQGALSTFMSDVLERLCACLGKTARGDYVRALSQSFVVSADNAHATHPNHPELYDEGNRTWMNQGVVIKESAAQHYTTNAVSRAFFQTLCRRAGVPTQTFANRSDSPGGSTIGNLLTRQVSVCSVDVGLPQLAMHSSFETAGTKDALHMIRALREFYAAKYSFGADGSIVLE